ncbi:hypothetical protein DFH08DRAFT_817562 [Mycena albidolilacea]|uniref:Uncharacterized protein n=1 Tax=Mycena albidolilacea TaxID=1033008 RepID=A0AAD6ZJ25_9AGAR|nr:hypothetical protein DFH08DRAFT_817562 [Mycena albidolilacea]
MARHSVNSCITSQRQIFRKGRSGSVYEKAKWKRFKGERKFYCKDTDFTEIAFWSLFGSDPYYAMPYDTLHADDSEKWGKHLWPLLQTILATSGLKGSRRVAELNPKAYPILRNTIFNISTTQSDVKFAAEPTATWTTRAGKSAMLKVYSDFCPLVVRTLEIVPEGKHLDQRLRKARKEHLVEEVAASECALHLMDPEVQATRGEAFRQVKYGSLECVVNQEVQGFVYGHDCVQDAEARFDGYFAEVKGK